VSDEVTLTFGVDTRNMGLARAVSATMAARAGLTVDRLEDVRLAVDEAVSQVISEAPRDGEVTCRFEVTGDALLIDVMAPNSSGRYPSTDTFGWTVLRALVDEVSPDIDDSTLTLRLRVHRTTTVDV
jgi:serine/threonine-protein kinase RsbW